MTHMFRFLMALTLYDFTTLSLQIREAISHHGIQVYTCPSEGDHTEANHGAGPAGSIGNLNSQGSNLGPASSGSPLSDAMPFAIIGSEEEVPTSDGRKVRGRMYHWGVAEVENENHCDFKKLRALLFRSHMLDLIMTTEETHYENFRSLHRDQSGRINSVLGKKNSRYKEEEDQLRRCFTEQVKSKEAVFRQWEQRLIAERDKLNKDLEQEHNHITALTTEIKLIEERLNMKK